MDLDCDKHKLDLEISTMGPMEAFGDRYNMFVESLGTRVGRSAMHGFFEGSKEAFGHSVFACMQLRS